MLSSELFLLLFSNIIDFCLRHSEQDSHILQLLPIQHLDFLLLFLLLKLHIYFFIILFIICINIFLIIGSATHLFLLLNIMCFKIIHIIESHDFCLRLISFLVWSQWILIFIKCILNLTRILLGLGLVLERGLFTKE